MSQFTKHMIIPKEPRPWKNPNLIIKKKKEITLFRNEHAYHQNFISDRDNNNEECTKRLPIAQVSNRKQRQENFLTIVNPTPIKTKTASKSTKKTVSIQLAYPSRNSWTSEPIQLSPSSNELCFDLQKR